MNRKGFTLIELIATLVILGIVMGITIVSITGVFSNAKNKTEDVFVGTISDALDIYLATDAKKLTSWTECGELDKSYKTGVKVYKTTISMKNVIDSSMKPITENDLVNPANETKCVDSVNTAEKIEINIYRDEDHVYYYSVDRDEFSCLLNKYDVISNLPEGFVCN